VRSTLVPRGSTHEHDNIPIATALRRAAVGALAVLGLLLALGAVVRIAVEGTAIGRAELDVNRWIAQRRTGVLDALATVGSSITDTFTVLGVLVGAVTMLAASGHLRHGLLVVVAICTEFTVFLVTSIVIGRDRPSVEPLGEVPSTASFPSGHIAAAIALYGALAVVAMSLTHSRAVGRAGFWATAVLAAFVGLSRLYEGVHHPIDLVGGILLGVAALASASVSVLGPHPTVAIRRSRYDHADEPANDRGRSSSRAPSGATAR
jgi:undecaprenyl-diphosphatase